MWLFSFIIVLGAICSSTLLVSGADNCPAACSCLSTYDAFCINAGLTVPPSGEWPNLTLLDLSGNNFTSVTDGMFSSYPSLEKLDLRDNQIESVSVGAFRNMRIITILLDRNRITSLRYLDLPSSVYVLSVGYNPLSFSNGSPLPLAMGGIYTIDISGVGLENLDNQIVSGMTNIINMIARDNKFTSIDLGNLFGLRNLEYLDLRFNAIETIIAPPEGIQLPVEVLYLSYNQLTHLDQNVISAFPYLYNLDVSANPIVIPDNKLFISHPALALLNITQTYARSISSLTFDLPNLEWLIAKSCGLYSIKGAFVDKPLVEWVDVGYNALTEISAGTFAGTGDLKEIDLNSNPLVSVDLQELASAIKGGSNNKVDIEDTPLACSCGYNDIAEWAASSDVTLFVSCSNGGVCAPKKSATTVPRLSTSPQQTFDLLGNVTDLGLSRRSIRYDKK